MKTVNIKDARTHLSDLVKLAEKGNEITITRHGKKVAKLIPATTSGKILPSLKSFRDTITVKGKPLSQLVIQERRKERY